MSEHYTERTESDTAYCKRCGKRTQHDATGKRLGRCLECQPSEGKLTKRQEQDRARRKHEQQNPTLF